MHECNRRAFLTASAGAAACLATVGRAEEPSDAPPAPPRVPIGKTGITTSRLAMGTGVKAWDRQSNQTRMGFEKFVALFRHAYDRGVTFFDLADLYGTHVYFREALRKIPRDKVQVLTKLWWRYDGETNTTESYRKKTAATAIQRFCHELTTDYIDILLLHCMTTAKWDEELKPYMEALTEAKQKKKVRAVGVSCHDLGALHKAAKTPWVDVVLARINPKGAKMDGKPDDVIAALKEIKQAGKAVVGMKIFGEGELVKQKDECIKFAQGLGLLDAMTIGFEAPQQIDEVLTLLAKHPAAKMKE